MANEKERNKTSKETELIAYPLTLIAKSKVFLEMIRFEHTVFALPFAYAGYLLGARGRFDAGDFFWITVAMASARTAGMCLNRIFDRDIDAKNPRTKTRALVTGAIRVRSAWAAVIAASGIFFIAAWRLDPLCLALSPVAALFVAAYHGLKRITPLCHFGIGLVLSCAPLGGWIAATGRIEPAALWLGAGVLVWVAGFDILYGTQDLEFDRREGLHSLPAFLGNARAVGIAGVLHLATLFFLSAVGIILALKYPFWIGLGLAALILIWEHRLMRGGRVAAAFLTTNGALSIAMLIFVALSFAVV